MINAIILIGPTILKITDLITWPWIWVLFPIWIPILVITISFLIERFVMPKDFKLFRSSLERFQDYFKESRQNFPRIHDRYEKHPIYYYNTYTKSRSKKVAMAAAILFDVIILSLPISPIVLKINNIITWSWWWVLCPVFLITWGGIIGFIIVLIEMRKQKN